MSGISFVKNNFQIRSGTKIYDKKTSSAVGLTREKIKDANSRDAFVDANLLVGDFIMQALPDGSLQTDFMFDDFLAAAKISKAFDVTSTDFKPFLAVVNIPEITHIPTPLTNDGSPDFNRKIRDIILTLGVFKLYNYTGYEFAVPNYGDPVQVTFKDMDTFTDPIFIRPLKTGVVNFPGAPAAGAPGSSYYDDCNGKESVSTTVPRPGKAPPTFITSGKQINKFITSLSQVDIKQANSTFATKTGASPENTSTQYKIVIPKNIDKTKSVNIFLYFHGDGNSGAVEKLITEGPSFMPDGYNSVILWPFLNSVPSNETKYTVTPRFLDEVYKHGFTGGVASVFTFSHSGGGGPHGYFLKQLAQKGIFDSTINASRFLDSDYNFVSISQLFNGLADGSIPKIDQSKITFVVGLQHPKHPRAPWKTAKGEGQGGKGQRWQNVYTKGTRTIVLDVGHMTCAYQIGPEYLFPKVVASAPAPAPSEKSTPNGKAEDNAGKDATEAQGTSGSTGDQKADELKEKGVGQPKTDPKSETEQTNWSDEAKKDQEKLKEVNEKIKKLEQERNKAVDYRAELQLKLDQFIEKYPDSDPPGEPSAFSSNYSQGFETGDYELLKEDIGKADEKIISLEKQLDELALDKEEAELYVDRNTKRAKRKEKTDKNTPNVNSTSPTQSTCPPAGDYVIGDQGPFPDSLKWVKILDFPPRVHQRFGKKVYGTMKMYQFLKGLNNIKGGEDLGKGGYKNPVHLFDMKTKGKIIGQKGNIAKGMYEIHPDQKPGWYFGDVSEKSGGDYFKTHITHQSGIGVDISIPTKNVVNGKTYRGMNVRIGEKQKEKGGSRGFRWWGNKGTQNLRREHVDEVALMDFLKYAIPKSIAIIFGVDQVKYAGELIQAWSQQGKNGWSLTHPAYLQAAWPGRKWPEGQKPKVTCRLSPDDKSHNNHFHLRLRDGGLAPGPFKPREHRGSRAVIYPPDARPGWDKKGGGWKQGDGRIDEGQPGWQEKKTDYKSDKGK